MVRGGRGGLTVRHGVALVGPCTVEEAAELMHKLQMKATEAAAAGAAGGAKAQALPVAPPGVQAEQGGQAPRPALGSAAQRLLGLSAELVELLGAPTLAQGVKRLRDARRRPPPRLERSWRAVDAAASLLRHPGAGDGVLADTRAWLLGDGGGSHAESSTNDGDGYLFGSDGGVQGTSGQFWVDMTVGDSGEPGVEAKFDLEGIFEAIHQEQAVRTLACKAADEAGALPAVCSEGSETEAEVMANEGGACGDELGPPFQAVAGGGEVIAQGLAEAVGPKATRTIDEHGNGGEVNVVDVAMQQTAKALRTRSMATTAGPPAPCPRNGPVHSPWGPADWGQRVPAPGPPLRPKAVVQEDVQELEVGVPSFAMERVPEEEVQEDMGAVEPSFEESGDSQEGLTEFAMPLQQVVVQEAMGTGAQELEVGGPKELQGDVAFGIPAKERLLGKEVQESEESVKDEDKVGAALEAVVLANQAACVRRASAVGARTAKARLEQDVLIEVVPQPTVGDPMKKAGPKAACQLVCWDVAPRPAVKPQGNRGKGAWRGHRTTSWADASEEVGSEGGAPEAPIEQLAEPDLGQVGGNEDVVVQDVREESDEIVEERFVEERPEDVSGGAEDDAQPAEAVAPGFDETALLEAAARAIDEVAARRGCEAARSFAGELTREMPWLEASLPRLAKLVREAAVRDDGSSDEE